MEQNREWTYTGRVKWFLTKVSSIHNEKKDTLFIKWWKDEIVPSSYSIHKNNSKCVKLKHETKTAESLEENLVETQHNIGVGNYFSGFDHKSTGTKSQNKPSRGSHRVKRQLTD